MGRRSAIAALVNTSSRDNHTAKRNARQAGLRSTMRKRSFVKGSDLYRPFIYPIQARCAMSKKPELWVPFVNRPGKKINAGQTSCLPGINENARGASVA